MKRAIQNIKLDLANQTKLDQLDTLSQEYMRIVQAYIDIIFEQQCKDVGKYDVIPTLETALSARWQRCAWQQAVGIMQSWFSNEHTHKPVLDAVTIQANANVVKIEVSHRDTFDFWLRISTLEKGHPIRIPVKMYGYGWDVLNQAEKLCSSVRLNKQDGIWYATFVVENKQKKPPLNPANTIGVDLGISNLFTTKEGFFGQFSKTLKVMVDKTTEKNRRRQKLNACLIKKGKPPVRYHNHPLNRRMKNEIGFAINQLVSSLPKNHVVILEKLSISAMRFKSRRMNRILKASKIAYALEKLKEKLDNKRIRYASVPAAYSSQECNECGYIHEDNRPTQALFRCGYCGYQSHADVNASKVLPKRFGDTELLTVNHYREVKTILMKRFFKRFPDARSVSGGLELSDLSLREIGCLQPTVNQST